MRVLLEMVRERVRVERVPEVMNQCDGPDQVDEADETESHERGASGDDAEDNRETARDQRPSDADRRYPAPGASRSGIERNGWQENSRDGRTHADQTSRLTGVHRIRDIGRTS